MDKHVWIGNVQSVNKWHGARSIKKGNKNIAMIYETTEYKQFKRSLALSFKGMEKQSGYVDLQVIVVLSSRADTGNIDKPIGDALEDAGVIDNDKFIRNITYMRQYHPNSGTKNKYNDMIIVKLIPIKQESTELIMYQQKNDIFNLKRKI